MSTALQSLSETKPHAPLSSGQTLAVFQQLHADILNAMQLIEDQRRGLERQGDNLLKLTNDVSLTNTSLNDLKKDFRALTERVEVVGRQATDGLELGEKVRQGLLLAREDIGFLREGQQKTNTNADILRSDLKARGEDIKGLRADIDDVLKVAVQNLQEKADQALLGLKAINLDHEKSKKDASVHRTWLQSLDDGLKAARCDVEKLDSTLGKQGIRLADACDSIADTRTNLEITNAVVYKMNETREATMLDISDLKNSMKAANARMEGAQAENGKAARELSSVRDDLATTRSSLGEVKQGLERASDQIMSLQDNQDRTGQQVGRLSNDLAKVRNLADSTQQHLEVTNSMVLPNLGSGDLSTTGFQSSMEGSRSLGGATGTSFGAKTLPGGQTPRRRREAAWVTRNIGLVPDRMSWI